MNLLRNCPFIAYFYLILGLAFFPAAPLFSQTVGPVPSLAIELAPSFQYDLSNDAFYSRISYSRIASSDQVSPLHKSAGVVQTVFLSIGTRTKDFSDLDFRWRAGLLNMDMVRLPLSMGVTLLDFNQVEQIDLDIQWFNLRLGPSIYLGNPRTYLTMKAVGTLGLTTARLGRFSFEGLASLEDLSFRKRSYEVGYIGEIQLFLSNLVFTEASFQHRHLLGGIRPKLYTITGVIGVRISSYLSLRGSYILEAARASSSSLERDYLSIGLGFLF